MDKKVYGICDNKCLVEVPKKDEVYNKDEIDNKLSVKSDTSHNHNNSYYSKDEIDNKLSVKSDTSHNHDNRYYTESESNARYKLKGDFAVITGNKTIAKNTGENISINYPNGFNENNCVVISTGIKYSNVGFNYVGQFDNDAMDMYWNAYKRIVTLGNSNITLRINNPSTTSDQKFEYKIVLMKVS